MSLCPLGRSLSKQLDVMVHSIRPQAAGNGAGPETSARVCCMRGKAIRLGGRGDAGEACMRGRKFADVTLAFSDRISPGEGRARRLETLGQHNRTFVADAKVQGQPGRRKRVLR